MNKIEYIHISPDGDKFYVLCVDFSIKRKVDAKTVTTLRRQFINIKADGDFDPEIFMKPMLGTNTRIGIPTQSYNGIVFYDSNDIRSIHFVKAEKEPANVD